MLLNFFVGEGSWESLGQKGDPTSPFWRKSVSPEYSLEGLMLKLNLQYFGHLMWRMDSFEKTWCWKRLKVGGERDDRGWDGWMASLTQWTWVLVNSGSWWWTGGPGMLQSMGSARVGHDWATELNWTDTTLLLLFSKHQLIKDSHGFTIYYWLSQWENLCQVSWSTFQFLC